MFNLRLFKKNLFLRYCYYCSKPTPKNLQQLLLPTKPCSSILDSHEFKIKTNLDNNTIKLLENLSMIKCTNKESIERSITFADYLQQINTEGIEPLITPLEYYPLRVREDSDIEGTCREDILKNSVVTEDEYFVGPSGNVPLETDEDLKETQIK